MISGRPDNERPRLRAHRCTEIIREYSQKNAEIAFAAANLGFIASKEKLRPAKGHNTIKRGPGRRIVEGRNFKLADEVRYIQHRAADHDSRIVTIGQLVLFSTQTGDAWLLDPADRLAARLARDGESEPVHIEETDTTFAIACKGRYRIQGPAFDYSVRETGRTTTILGYPIDKLALLA